MLNLFAVLILPSLMIGLTVFSIVGLLLWLIAGWFPAPVVPGDDEDEIVGDGSTLRSEAL